MRFDPTESNMYVPAIVQAPESLKKPLEELLDQIDRWDWQLILMRVSPTFPEYQYEEGLILKKIQEVTCPITKKQMRFNKKAHYWYEVYTASLVWLDMLQVKLKMDKKKSYNTAPLKEIRAYVKAKIEYYKGHLENL